MVVTPRRTRANRRPGPPPPPPRAKKWAKRAILKQNEAQKGPFFRSEGPECPVKEDPKNQKHGEFVKQKDRFLSDFTTCQKNIKKMALLRLK